MLVALDVHSLLDAGAGPDEGREVRSVDCPPPAFGGFDELESHGEAGGREPGPLVTLVRSRTVAKVDSIGLVVLRWIQCSVNPHLPLRTAFLVLLTEDGNQTGSSTATGGPGRWSHYRRGGPMLLAKLTSR